MEKAFRVRISLFSGVSWLTILSETLVQGSHTFEDCGPQIPFRESRRAARAA